MKVKYQGPHDVAEIPLPGKRPAKVENGESIDVPSDVARGLLASDAWTEDKPKKTTKTKTASSAGKDTE